MKFTIPYNAWNIHELPDNELLMRIKIKGKTIIPIKIFGHPYLLSPTFSSNPVDEQSIIDICINYPNERLSRNVVLPILDKDDIFIDVGAMYGSWSLPAVALGAKVIAIEPEDGAEWILQTQRDINKFEDRITIVYDKISNKKNERLDYLVDVLSIDRCKLIKIDVEGMEFDVLKSAIKIIDKYLPSLLVELHSGKIEEYLQWFETDISSKYRHFVMDQRINEDSAPCYHVYHHL